MHTFIFISDTHTKHFEIDEKLKSIYKENPDSTIIHCGDISYRGLPWEVQDFVVWFAELPFRNKIMISGNHDFLFEEQSSLAKDIFQNMGPEIIYLEDSGVEIEGIKIWGSPVTPRFHDWAFNRDENIQDHWDLIPNDTNILITHGPVKGILDTTIRGGLSVGCPLLRDKIFSDLKDLKIHACGHIHEAYGLANVGDITFINASNATFRYDMENDPIVVKI